MTAWTVRVSFDCLECKAVIMVSLAPYSGDSHRNYVTCPECKMLYTVEVMQWKTRKQERRESQRK